MLSDKLKRVLMQDRQMLGGIDPLEAVIFLTSKFTLLPEVFDIFGKEGALEFLTRFGGKAIKIPHKDTVEEALLHLSIWQTLTQDNSPANVKKLQLRHGMSQSEVLNAFSRVQAMVDGYHTRFVGEGTPTGEFYPKDEETSTRLESLFGVDN